MELIFRKAKEADIPSIVKMLADDELGHKSLTTTERYCNIPIKRLEDDFPTYAKVAKNGDVPTLYVPTKPLKMESLLEK